MENCLYEFGFHLHWYDLFKIFALIFPLLIWLFSDVFDKHKWVKLGVKIVSLCLFLFIVWSLFVFPVVQYHSIKQAVDDGNVLVIEGEVSNLETPSSSLGGHATESFNIGDVFFSYSGTENYGYCRFRCQNGVIRENGQKLKIVYYTDPDTGSNTICYIYEMP